MSLALSCACAERDQGHVLYRLAHSLPLAEQLGEAAAIELGADAPGVLLDGWSFAERSGAATFRWSDGDRSAARFVMLEPRAATLRFEALAVAPHLLVMGVDLAVNGRPIERWLQAAGATHATAIEPGVLRPGWNTIELRYRHPLEPAPGSRERRRLGVAWHHIAIDREGGAELRAIAGGDPPVLPDLVAGRLLLAAGTGLLYDLDLDPSELVIDSARALRGRTGGAPGGARLRLWLERADATWDLGSFPLPQRGLRVPLPLDEPSAVRLGIAVLPASPDPSSYQVALRAARLVAR